jgi:spore germination protein YaaH
MNNLSKTHLRFHHMHRSLHVDNQESPANINSNLTQFVNQNPDSQDVTKVNTTPLTDRSISTVEPNQPDKSNCISCQSQAIVNELEEKIQNPSEKKITEPLSKAAQFNPFSYIKNEYIDEYIYDDINVDLKFEAVLFAIAAISWLVVLVIAIVWKAIELIIFLNTGEEPRKLAAATLVNDFIKHLDDNISETESINLNCDLKQLNNLMLDDEIMNTLDKLKKTFNEFHNPKDLTTSDTLTSNHELVKDLTNQLFSNLFVKLDKIVDNESQDKLNQAKQKYLNSFFNTTTGVIDPSKCKLLECILPLDTESQPVINHYFLDAISQGIKQYMADNNLKQTKYTSLYDL